MDFPAMTLCSDRKRGLNSFPFVWKTKSSNSDKVPNMFSNNGVMFQTHDGCQTGYINSKPHRFHGLFEKSYNQSPFITSISLVGGFLGSKSQVRSNINQDQCIWDFIKFAENLYNASTEIIKPYLSDQFGSSSAPSPPKKKFAKEESHNLESSKSDFPLVAENLECVLTASDVNSPKQSYAEVAKSICSRITAASGLNKESVPKRENCVVNESHQRRRQRRRNYRKHKKEKRHFPPQSSCESVQGSSVLGVRKDNHKQSQTDLSQNSPLKNCSGSQNFPKQSLKRNSREFNCLQSSGRVSREHWPNYHSGIGQKRPPKSRIYNCDIEKVNWRTGEPIKSSMPFDGESFRRDKPEAMETEPVSCCDQHDHGNSNKLSDCSTEASPSADQPYSQSYNRRRSFSSECSVESEDSFIVFQAESLSDSISDISGNWSDLDSDDSFDDDSDSLMEPDTFDGCNVSSSSQRLQEINTCWENSSATLSVPESSDALPHSRKIENRKKVHFTSSKPKVHWMLAWDYAYRSSRVGPWEEMARDRARFQSRILQYENLLSPVLSPDHRAKIWKRLQSHF